LESLQQQLNRGAQRIDRSQVYGPMMKALIILAALLCPVAALAQIDAPDALGSPTGFIPASTGSVKFSPAIGTISGATTICLSSTPTCGTNLPNTDIFYTLDGSPATEASTWYSCKTSTTGCIALPAPSANRTIVINALLVQTTCTSLSCSVSTNNPCSVAVPCYGVISQNGQNVKADLKTNVSCTFGQCPSASLAAMPDIHYGSGAGGSNGTNGVVTQGLYNVNLSQPSVDVYGNTNTGSEFDQSTAGSTAAGGGSLGDTETLETGNKATNIGPGTTTGCDQCKFFAVSYYIAYNYQNTVNSPLSSVLNPATQSEQEMDQNVWDISLGTLTGCKNGDFYCYLSYNLRASMQHAPPTTFNGITYGALEHNGQEGGWKAFPTPRPNHDVPFPFGKMAALGTTGCPTGSNFTPGITIYQGEHSWPIEPGGFLLWDMGTSNAESVQLLGAPGGSITGCVRGVGGTAHSHATNSLATETVLFQYHATHGPASTTSNTCVAGEPKAPDALFYDYVNINNNIYATAAAMGWFPSSGNSKPNVLQTWGTQTVAGNGKIAGGTFSSICDYASNSSTFGDPSRYTNQKQLYSKAGSGVTATIGIWDLHDNLTADFGILGPPSQMVYVQAP
jgi:hypothetical protein